MARDQTPAIERMFGETDRDLTVTGTPHDDVSFVRGLGDSGRRVEMVEHDCPFDHCSHDRMIRLTNVSPEQNPYVKYWCLSPNCPYFVSDTLSWACHGSSLNFTEPAVYGRSEA